VVSGRAEYGAGLDLTHRPGQTVAIDRHIVETKMIRQGRSIFTDGPRKVEGIEHRKKNIESWPYLAVDKQVACGACCDGESHFW